MHIGAGVVGAVCTAAVAVQLSASFQSRPAKSRPRDPAIEALVDEAATVAPEFAADILIRVAVSEKPASDPEWKRELLEEAFRRAAAVREPYRRSANRLPEDSRPGALLQAYDIRLDRVSLQSRIVLGMLPVDPARALELFEWIDLRLEPGTCEDVLVPAADEYYNALTQLARYMARSSRGRADAFQLLVLYLWRAWLPSEMPAVVKAIRSFEPTLPEALYLDEVLRTILDHSLRDPRSFSTAGFDLVAKISDLADDEHHAGLSPSILLQGFRRYLVEQLTGPRCADSGAEASIAEAFNMVLKHPGVAAHGLDPLTAKDVRPSSTLPPARIDWYWRALEARRLHAALGRLRGPDRQPLSEPAKGTREWQSEADAFLTDLERWTGARERSEADDFYQRSVLFAVLFDLAPQANLRARTMTGFLDVLRHSMVSRERPALWLLPAARLLESQRGSRRREVLDAFEQSGQSVLVLYAHANRVVTAAPARKTGGDS